MTAADDIASFYVHSVSVETYEGPGAYGDTFATAVVVPGFFSGSQKQVRDTTGQIVEAASMFYTYPANAGLFVPNSRVTSTDGISRVVTTNLNDSGVLGLPDHVAVALI